MSKIVEYGKEAAEIVAKTALCAIPIGGTLITCVWDSVKANAAQKRLNEWKNMLEERLSISELTLEDLGNHELFASCIMKATDSALRSAQTEKRLYLANAVLNSTKIDIDENIAMIYLDMLERYSVLHIKILHYFNNPLAYGIDESNYLMGSAMQPLLDAIPELSDKTDLVNKIVKDLHSDGLMNTADLNGMMTPGGMVAKRTSQLGSNFIDFITVE